MIASVQRLIATEDPVFRAEVVERIPLRYAEGADPAQDRPAHVRAASGIHWIGDVLAVIQDDARFVALVSPADYRVAALALPADRGGIRVFDDLRGNKASKLDLETALVAQVEGEELLVTFGSGSKRVRDQIAIVNVKAGAAEVRDASRLYAELRRCREFSGSRLNVEGASLAGGVLRLFNRGNGQERSGRQPLNATVDIAWPAFWQYLENPGDAPVPTVSNVVQYELGMLHGLRLSFTDACALEGRTIYTAAAEDTPDATRDGPVAGSALGVIDELQGIRYAILRQKDGSVFRGKVEGVAVSRTEANRVYVVVDVDEPNTPSELCVVEVSPDMLATRRP